MDPDAVSGRCSANTLILRVAFLLYRCESQYVKSISLYRSVVAVTQDLDGNHRIHDPLHYARRVRKRSALRMGGRISRRPSGLARDPIGSRQVVLELAQTDR